MKIKLDPGAYMPERAHEADAGFDLRIPEHCDSFKVPKGICHVLHGWRYDSEVGSASIARAYISKSRAGVWDLSSQSPGLTCDTG